LSKHKLVIDIDLGAAWERTRNMIGRIRVDHFLLFIFAAHMLQIAFPSDGSKIFDEAHYVPASLQTLAGEAANLAHPPLPKIIGAIGIAVLGNNWFGWRFPQVVMQIAVLYLFYLIAKRFLGDPWALGATALLGLDTVFFIHGGALLLDMSGFLFGFLAFELYFRKRYGWSALSMGLALLSRVMCVFYFLTLAVYHLAANRRAIKSAVRIGLRYVTVSMLVFGILLWVYDVKWQAYEVVSATNVIRRNIILGPGGDPIATRTTTEQSISKEMIWNPVQHVFYMIRYHTSPALLLLKEPYRSYHSAWNWVLPIHISPNGTLMTDVLEAPTYFRIDVTVSSPKGVARYSPIWYRAAANPMLWYGIWLGIVGLFFAFRRKPDRLTPVLISTGLLSNFTPWLVMSVLVRKLGFNYPMLYTLPFVALAIGLFWKEIPKYGKLFAAIHVIAALAYFLYVFPVRPMP